MTIKPIASGSSGNCYFVSDGLTKILLDCGISFNRIQQALWDMGTGIPELSGCLVTHAHGDHVKAAQRLADRGVDIYASPGTIKAAGLNGHYIHETPRPSYYMKTPPEHPPWDTFDVGTFMVLPFDIEHDAPEPLAFILKSRDTGEKVIYATDTMYLGITVNGITHLMIEANYDSQVMAENVRNGDIAAARAKRTTMNHMSIDAALLALERLDKSKLQEVWLLHLSGDNAADDFKRRAQEVCGCAVYVA
jgi:phosphoribosyl 1,2-cyclic phosphodiesterase